MEIAFLYATIDERHFTKMKHLLLTFLWLVTQVVVLESYHTSPKYVKFVSKPLTRLDGIKNPWRHLDIKNSAIVRSLKANPLVNIVSRIYSYFWWLPRKNLPFEGPSKLFSNSTEEFLAYRQVPRNLPPIRYIADGLPDDFFCYGLPGNTLPYGNWDPCGFSQVPESVVRKFRESELKHGRLAMLATIGCLLQETWHPLYSSIGGMAVTHMAQFQTLPLQDNHLYQLLTPLSPVLKDLLDRYKIPLDFYTMFYFMMALESFFFVRNWSRWKRNEYDHQFIGNIGIGNLKPTYENGNYGFDPFRLMPDDPIDEKWIIEVELNHCRLAMIAFIGILAQEYISGVPAINFLQEVFRGHFSDFLHRPEFPSLDPLTNLINDMLKNLGEESSF